MNIFSKNYVENKRNKNIMLIPILRNFSYTLKFAEFECA